MSFSFYFTYTQLHSVLLGVILPKTNPTIDVIAEIIRLGIVDAGQQIIDKISTAIKSITINAIKRHIYCNC